MLHDRSSSSNAAPEGVSTLTAKYQQQQRQWLLLLLCHRTGYTVLVEASEPRRMVLHWAINDWEGPPEHIYPPGTYKVGVAVDVWVCTSGCVGDQVCVGACLDVCVCLCCLWLVRWLLGCWGPHCVPLQCAEFQGGWELWKGRYSLSLA